MVLGSFSRGNSKKISGFSTVTPFEFAGFTSLEKKKPKKGKNSSKLHIFQYTYLNFLIKTDMYKIQNRSEEISVFLLHTTPYIMQAHFKPKVHQGEYCLYL